MGTAQAEMFDLPQGDLFGTPVTPAYVVPHAIAVNTLRKTLALLSNAERWPWDPDMKTARMDRTVPKLLAVLPPDEADDWRGRIAAEATRLDAAA
ncbi:hypothetical protein [uncultured Brevundimonas sp.]|uniref:hypothetical protein n=1 Tax=uncultured Brevundimonas sp. TaxID=213418 RepID=UPI0030ED51AE|tara:strand:+ start:3313 stop:3597 length:285 start_codon:yes stop_codon:yes gene_type:complete